MGFRVIGLAPEPFRPLFELSDQALHAIGARRVIAEGPGLPCRVSLAHAAPGEELLLVNHVYQPADTPYRGTHAIYVRRNAEPACQAVDAVPEVLASRLLAVRAFDDQDMMIDADVCEGGDAAALFERLLADPRSGYLQVHNAKRGCYAARVERA